MRCRRGAAGPRATIRARRAQGRLGARRPDPVEGSAGREASTVHVGGTLEICASERDTRGPPPNART
jgi:hypothetical protein